jgi:hypothetical protein
LFTLLEMQLLGQVRLLCKNAILFFLQFEIDLIIS